MRSYLESNGNEVVDIIMNMFTQEYATEMYGKECERKGIIKATIRICMRLKLPHDEANKILHEEFGITTEEFLEYINNN